MVAGVVQQLQPAQQPGASRAPSADILSVIARDGVACEVSLVRSEVDIRPLAQTANSPGFGSLETPGFGHILKGGKAWRTYVLEENGIRIATADRIDVREHLVESFAYTLILPFLAALVGSLLLTWWCCTLGLRPLQRLQQELSRRPPRASSPVQAGQDVVELAPLVLSLNDLLGRMNAAIERERRWTADAAHELRTPLTAIKTHVQVAQLVLERAGFALPQAQAAHGFNDVLAQLSAQMMYMHIDRVAAHVELRAIEAVVQLAGRQHAAVGLHQRRQQCPFAPRQLHRLAPARDLGARHVDLEAAEVEPVAGTAAGAAQQRVQAQHQFGQVKRLGQVVVRAGLETRDLVLDAVARAEYQHRQLARRGAPQAQQSQAVAVGQAPIVNAGIEVAGRDMAARLGQAGGNVGGETVQLQPGLDAVGDQCAVFHNQYMHAGPERKTAAMVH
jgi:signal transduction histidine kinase